MKLKSLIQIILTIVLLTVIFQKINIVTVWYLFFDANRTYILIASLLILIHVLIKSYKWYILTKSIDSANTFRNSISSYLRGISLAIVTPSRIGEFGRVAGMKGNKLHLGSLTLVYK